MISVRFDPALIAAVKRLAGETGTTVSAWIRDAVRRESERQRRAWLDEHRRELEVVPGSGRAVPPRSIPSSLSLLFPPRNGGPARTFSCPHLSVGGAEWASCGQCGDLRAA